jgi:hypothetical protein
MVVPPDGDWISEAAFSWLRTHRWSYQGRTPTPEMIGRLLWDGVMVQEVVEDDNRRPVCLTQLYRVVLQSGYGYLGLLASHGHTGDLGPFVDRFCRGVFRDFPLRKLYVEVLADHADLVIGAVGSPTRLEATLMQHERVDEETYMDLRIYSIRRPTDVDA